METRNHSMLFVVVKDLLYVVLHRDADAVQMLIIIFGAPFERSHPANAETHRLRAGQETNTDSR
jgi:hypothetical protein